MKKTYISPGTSLLMSLSLALGILVSDLSGYRLLTAAHAQGGSCVSETVDIEDGVILSGLPVRNVVVNGNLLEHAVIAGGVLISNARVVGSNSVIHTDGVIIGSGNDSPCANGVIIGSGNASTTGVIIGSGNASANGVIIGSGNATIAGVTGDAVGAADGGTLTGDNITITDGGVITGQNLLLSGATFNDGSISGTITSIAVTPAN